MKKTMIKPIHAQALGSSGRWELGMFEIPGIRAESIGGYLLEDELGK